MPLRFPTNSMVWVRVQRIATRSIPFSLIGLLLLATGVMFTESQPTAAEASLGIRTEGGSPTLPDVRLGDAGLGANDFFRAAPQGLGDRHNSVIWSMAWWEKTGKLYVGTNRDFLCWSIAAISEISPILNFAYPPNDPDIDCTPDFDDLPLQAEIWAWTPPDNPDGPGTWERLYQSPQDVPIADTDPVKFVSRDIAYRTMTVFTEPDGTEALYVGAVSSKSFHHDAPATRILRSVDGANFEPIPQDQGTFMGELPDSSFRSLTPYDGELFVINGKAHGDGIMYSSENPAVGNDAWRQVSPDGLKFFELQTFNGFLYAGVLDLDRGYAVTKTDASGGLPYQFTPVVRLGAYLENNPSRSVVSMHEFDGRLYVGMDNPAELIRINPDDSWDLIVGTPRATPDGLKYPLSGLDEGFNYTLNEHIWRMQSHDGYLYVGTYDKSTTQRLCPTKNLVLRDKMGFDLYRTSDGVNFSAVTTDGFGDKFDFGVRTFQSTPYGLFLGTANYYYGANVYRAVNTLDNDGLDPPGNLRAALRQQRLELTWEASSGATRYRVFRSNYVKIPVNLTGFPGFPVGCPSQFEPVGKFSRLTIGLEAWQFEDGVIPLPGVEIGLTSDLSFTDTQVERGMRYSYHVVAEDDSDRVSGKSNFLSFPLLRLVLRR